MNKAKANGAKLVPLKDQAGAEIRAAQSAINALPRWSATRRTLASAKLAGARAAYRDGNYSEAASRARDAAQITNV